MDDSTFLLVERAVIETLISSEKSLSELQDETGLSPQILIQVLHILSERGILEKKVGKYLVNRETLINLKGPLKIDLELKELLGLVVREYFQKKQKEAPVLHLKKITLRPDDLKKLKAQMNSIEQFLLRADQKSKTKEKTVIFWGWAPYGQLIEGSLEV